MVMTVESGLRAAVVAADLVAGRVFRTGYLPDEPGRLTWPYITFGPMVSDVPGLRGDGGSLTHRREVPFDLWQRRADVDDELPERLRDVLERHRPLVEGRVLWRPTVTLLTEVDDPDTLVLHHSLTVALHHGRTTS